MYGDVNNRKLFAKKSQAARNMVRKMGGVSPMASQMSGIMASSPELMQAAMRRPVVLPVTTQPMAAPAPMSQMLPPSRPIPNIAGIPQGPVPSAPAPRPMAKKPGVKKLFNGGPPLAGSDLLVKDSPIDFTKAYRYGQKAITTENPAELGLPEGANLTVVKKKLDKPEEAAKELVEEVVPEKERTGDTKKDLVKAAVKTGIERVPAEAEIDELNKAIFGAKLAGAIAGSYVNPQTGQAVRPTAGARIAQAAVEGLAVARDTETRRAAQEAELAAAKMRAAGKTGTTSFLETPQGEAAEKMYLNRVENNQDPAEVEAMMNAQIGNNIGTRVRQAIAGQAAPAPTSTGSASTYPPGSIINQGGNRFRVDDNGVPQLIQGE